MKNETVKTLVLMAICAAGGLLVGFNAAKLSQSVNALLFVLGICLLAGATTILGLLETVWKKKR